MSGRKREHPGGGFRLPTGAVQDDPARPGNEQDVGEEQQRRRRTQLLRPPAKLVRECANEIKRPVHDEDGEDQPHVVVEVADAILVVHPADELRRADDEGAARVGWSTQRRLRAVTRKKPTRKTPAAAPSQPSTRPPSTSSRPGPARRSCGAPEACFVAAAGTAVSKPQRSFGTGAATAAG